MPPNPGPLFKYLYVTKDRTFHEIMAEYDIGYRQLRNLLRAQGVEFRSPGPREQPPATPEMVADYATMSFKAMTAKYHSDRETIRYRLTLAGVTIRSRGRPVGR